MKSPPPVVPELVVTNFNRNFTGVSATADQLLRHQERQYELLLAGYPLPAVQSRPQSVWRAIRASRRAPQGRACVVWHVRRNAEMFWALVARDLLQLPVRIAFTSAAIRRHSWFPRQLIARMDAVIATSPKAAALVPNVAAVAPHGVDVERFRPAADRAAAWRATGYPGRRGVATIGRVRPEKGTDLFVDAMLRVLPKHPDVTALVIGTAEPKHAAFEAKLRRQITDAGLAERILFTGQVDKERLPALVSALSLVVATPRYEGYGMTGLEAMASGTPVVLSDTGAFAAFLANGASGILTPLEDASAVAAAAERILGDATLFARLAAGARETAVAEFAVDRELAGVAAVYEQLWDSARSAVKPASRSAA